MFRSPMLRKALVATVLGLMAAFLLTPSAQVASAQDSSRRGRKYKSPAPTARVDVVVLRGTTGKPIENASVILRPLHGVEESGSLELKTDDEGKAGIDLFAPGDTVRLQIIADGWQTYGQDFKVDKDPTTIEVKLHRPVKQYSAYKANEGKPADGAGKDGAGKTPPPEDKPAPKPDAGKPDPATKSAPDANTPPAETPAPAQPK